MSSYKYVFILFVLFTAKAFGLDVAIIGAGASGLTAAHYLKKEGHQVTIFEKNDRVGGKVHTVEVDGSVIELGALVTTPGFKTINHLARIYGPSVRVLPSKIQFLTHEGQWRNFKGYSALGPVGTFVQYNRLIKSFKRFPELGTPHLVSSIHPDLFLPLTDFARKYGFYEVLPPFVMSLSASGYLFPENIPAYYALKLFKTIAPVGIQGYIENLGPFASSYLRGLRYFKGGFSQLWENMARHFDVRLSEEVLSVTKGSVMTTKGDYHFDRIVISTDLPTAKDLVPNASSELVTVAHHLKKHRFLISVIKTDDLPKSAHRSFFFYPNMTIKRINHIQSMVNFWDDPKIHVTYQTLDNEISWEKARAILASDLRETLGVKNFTVMKGVEWPYFHHIDVGGFNSEISNALKSLQGNDGIYFVGESLNFESTESAAQNAKYVIEQFFR